MNKPFLRSWQNTSKKLAYCLEKGITPICAFIIEEPGQDDERREATIQTAIECVRLGCEIHINTLSIYNETALALKIRPINYSSIKPELLMDTPPLVQSNALARLHPHLFPYHSTYCEVREWEIFTVKAYTLFALLWAFPKTISEYVVEENQSIWKSLEFIDEDTVSWIRSISPQEKRLASLLKFSKHFAFNLIGEKTTFLLDIWLVFIFSLDIN